tara:strand:+ start:83 stop:1024 length:942 start_codon:yes stop_codon:yes gene_type:complete
MHIPKGVIGFDTSEDCSVFPINDNEYLIQSVDFFTPIVDDPYLFGKIAAANSLSDIYAMGGKPLYALNIAEFPSNSLPWDILLKILQGGLDTLNELNIPILGGHTIKDSIPKYGMVVTGIVNKKHLTLNSTACEGDSLLLTKPLGTGIISTAMKQDKASSHVIKLAITNMTMLNKTAANTMNKIGVSACTDITGYGLLGHLLEMCQSSNISAQINYNKIPFIEGVYELAKNGFIPGGTKNNLEFVLPNVHFEKNITLEKKYLLADAQTSGGLLISVDNKKAVLLKETLDKTNMLSTSIIGTVIPKKENSIYVT